MEGQISIYEQYFKYIFRPSLNKILHLKECESSHSWYCLIPKQKEYLSSLLQFHYITAVGASMPYAHISVHET